MTPAFKDGFVDELQKIAALPALVPLALKAGAVALKSPAVQQTALNTLGGALSKRRQPSQGTGMSPAVGGL